EVLDGVALRGGVLGVTADVEIEAGAVLEEHVAAASPRHHTAEQVAGDLVGAEPALAAQGAGDPVFVLQAEYAPIHSLPRYRSRDARHPNGAADHGAEPVPRPGDRRPPGFRGDGHRAPRGR